MDAKLYKHYYSTVLRDLKLSDSDLIFFEKINLLRLYTSQTWESPSATRETLALFFLMIMSGGVRQLSREWWWFMAERLKCLLFLDQWLFNEKLEEKQRKELVNCDKLKHIPIYVTFISMTVSILEESTSESDKKSISTFETMDETFGKARDNDIRGEGFSKFYTRQS